MPARSQCPTRSSPPCCRSETPRPRNPFAPSLPLLTDEEEANLDRVINRLILADTGKLKGEEAKQAMAEFNKLGPEAIPALIRGVNRAAAIEHSCPVVLIAKKLGGMLGTSNDPELLEFARENIGAGVKATKHKGVLNTLRVQTVQRKNSLARAALTAPRTASGKVDRGTFLKTLREGVADAV